MFEPLAGLCAWEASDESPKKGIRSLAERRLIANPLSVAKRMLRSVSRQLWLFWQAIFQLSERKLKGAVLLFECFFFGAFALSFGLDELVSGGTRANPDALLAVDEDEPQPAAK